jgi:hypothetical protein
MAARLFHVFRNNPFGRETLLQSIYFCKKVGASLLVYIPKHKKFSMHFKNDNDIVQVDLDKSYLTSPDTALKNATEVAKKMGIRARFLDPKHYNTSMLPDIQPNFDFMTCPRSISDLSSKIGLGYLGPRVKRIVESARFPVLITTPAYKEWDRLSVFFDGSAEAVKALKLGFRISQASGIRLDVFPLMEKGSRESYEKVIKDKDLQKEIRRRVNKWHIFEKGTYEEILYKVPHNALVVLGAFGNSPLKDIAFGSKMGKIQSTLPNNLLIAGPNYTEPNTSIPSWFPFL